MFRTVCKSYRLLNGFVISCRFGEPARGLRADDVTKFTTGILHQAHTEIHHQAAFSPYVLSTTIQLRVSHSLYCHRHHHHHHHLHHHLPSYPLLTNVIFLSLRQWASSSELCALLQAASFSTSRDGIKRKNSTTQSRSGVVNGAVSSAEEAAPKAAREEAATKLAGEEGATKSAGEEGAPTSAAGEGEEKLSIFKRFKRAYKEHGKILVGVHVATSIVWYGSFYALARGGVDIVPYLEHWGFSETVIKPFRAGGLGDFAVAYLMYKLATPARYTVTLAGTNLVIRYLRSKGKMAPKSQEDSLRELYKEGRRKLRNSRLRQIRLKKLREGREKKKSTGLGSRK